MRRLQISCHSVVNSGQAVTTPCCFHSSRSVYRVNYTQCATVRKFTLEVRSGAGKKEKWQAVPPAPRLAQCLTYACVQYSFSVNVRLSILNSSGPQPLIWWQSHCTSCDLVTYGDQGTAPLPYSNSLRKLTNSSFWQQVSRPHFAMQCYCVGSFEPYWWHLNGL